ncbi:DNA excision repair protein ERCC-6 [Aplysia californica]|uniref:DNA excision repair protein ERCC-6 n=1 Tax=Aplysia californica TaxID=6500 RepID=A0ABM0JNT8_APLCA|nr:DNA excision repair protein ERCC-6 [Aplysia californica]
MNRKLTPSSSASTRKGLQIDEPSTSSGGGSGTNTKEKDAFQVDTGLIPQAMLEEQGTSELQELGLSVFNQDVFEQGIMEQVDDALAKEEELRLRKILERELTTINDDINMAKKDLERVNIAETNLEEQGDGSREVQRQLESMRRQKENKVKQLKTLKVRKENVQKKLAGIDQTGEAANEDDESTFDQAFQLKKKPQKESERERMIRTGEMTPFGTMVKTKPSTAAAPGKAVRLSEFEKLMGARESTAMKAKKDFSKYLKKKSGQAQKPQAQKEDDGGDKSSEPRAGPSNKSKRNRFDERDWRVYDKETDYTQPKFRKRVTRKIQHSFSGDIRLSDEEDFDRDEDAFEDDEDVYEPSKQELREESSDDFNDDDASEDELGKAGLGVDGKRKRSRKKALKKPRPLPKYRENSDDDEPVRTKVKRDLSIRREKDDADPETYNDRLIKQQKLDKKEEKLHANAKKQGDKEDEEEEDDGEFDGGLRVPPKLWRKLFKYQKTGVRWLWELHTQQAGGIVGDEMGLGKTIQTISFLASLRTSKVRNVNFPYKGLGPTIIICPTTVMHQWLKEFHKWWPEFRVAILHSSGTFTGSESELVRSIAKSHGVLVTSYNTLVIHQELVLRFNWHYVILDEGHKIRNPDAKVTICCKQFRTPHRIILSGSPIQNNLKELWSLFDFVFPGKLGTLPDFMQHFSIPIVQGGYSNATQIQVETAYRCACVLRDTINPYLIRRMKADVKKNLELPNKNEQVLFCRLTDEQRDVYQEYLDSRECNAIIQGKFQVFSGLITLRKICNHSDLSTGGPQVFRGDTMPGEPEYQYGYWRRSGKMIVVEALLRLWYKQQHRVLLFTQSKSMLDILEKFVQDQGYSYLTMDGGTSISARQPLISQYNNDTSIYMFLLTTRVGGLGVNLTGADRVIIYDPDWNPSTDIQARERAWRIGQKRQVTIYRLLTSGTIEEKIYHRQIFKQFLTNRVLKDPKQRRLFKSQDVYELFTLGSKDNEEGTETSALFAGTGSDVKVPKRLKATNRFDEMREKKIKEQEEKDERETVVEEQLAGTRESERNHNKDEDEDNMGLGEEELDRMKEFARKLSQKMEMEKKSKQDREKVSPPVEVKKERDEEETEEVRPDEVSVKHESEEVQGTEIKFQAVKEEDTSADHAYGCSNINGEEGHSATSDLVTDASLTSDKTQPQKWHRNGKLWSIPLRKKRKSSSEEKDGVEDRKNNRSEHSKEQLSQTSAEKESRHRRKNGRHGRGSSEDDQGNKDSKREKRKRKHRNARFEGERIPNLVKHCPLPSKNSSEDHSEEKEGRSVEEEKEDQHHDDFVLRELFKKTGIQGAMKHDKIMDSGRPDYAIVEAEAAKVAREAVAALRRSRQQCASAISGLPTWTGQHGATVSKPRFGQKKNSLLVNKSDKGDGSSGVRKSPTSESQSGKKPKEKEEKEKLFDGTVSGNISLGAKNGSLTSSDLLSRMQARKRISATAVDDDDDFLRPDRHETLDPKDSELLEDIRNYVAFMAVKDGEASTQEIVLNFGQRLPKTDAPKFKAMLNQVCDFQSGFWKLKAEFR